MNGSSRRLKVVGMEPPTGKGSMTARPPALARPVVRPCLGADRPPGRSSDTGRVIANNPTDVRKGCHRGHAAEAQPHGSGAGAQLSRQPLETSGSPPRGWGQKGLFVGHYKGSRVS